MSRLPRGMLVLGVVSIVNVALAFVREATIAYFFGTSSELDTFLVALTIPKLLVVNFTQLSVAVVLPIYISYRQAERFGDATALVQKWFWFSGTVVACVCAFLFVGADFFMHLLAPGFDAVQREESATWLRLLLPYVWILSVAGIFKVVLNSNDRFAVPAISGELVSVCIIAFCAVGAHSMGAGALAAGFVAGGMLGFTWQLFFSRRFESRLPSFTKLQKKIKLPIVASGAMLFHYGARQLDALVDRAFASGLPDGSIAAYNYAQMINSIPSAVVISALSTALFPVLSRMVAAGNLAGAFRTARRWAIALVLLGIGPVLLLVHFRERVVSIVFERGAFDESGVYMTSQVLSVLPFLILVSVVLVMFTILLLAQQRTREVGVVSITAITVKIGLNYFLVDRYGLMGLATATLIAATLSTFILVVLAWWRKGKQAVGGIEI